MDELRDCKNCNNKDCYGCNDCNDRIVLDRSYKQLSSLPPEIGQLSQLKELYCSNNQLMSLPVEIIELTGLNKIYFGDITVQVLTRDIRIPDNLLNHEELKLIFDEYNIDAYPLTKKALVK